MKIKITIFLIAILLSFLTITSPVHANAQALGTCFIDSLTGKERKLLVKWIFFSMASHPELKPFSNFNETDTDAADKSVGKLITRLFIEDCPTQVKAAQKADPLALRKAFELVGQFAMQDLMTNENVMAAISNYAIYADQSKINSLFVE